VTRSSNSPAEKSPASTISISPSAASQQATPSKSPASRAGKPVKLKVTLGVPR
jgi:hypothetical protein